ncbi:MAG TPA: amidohydrolase family protein [Acidimicrobiales bacterium]
MLDAIVKDGAIVDGTGSPRRHGDVGIRDGRIVAIGEVDEPAAKVIDAEGRIVAPGFVDVHTHYDAQVLWDPTLAPSTLHGITSMVGGNCGFSVAPLDGDAASYLMTMLARVEGMPLASLEASSSWDWGTTDEYLGRIEGAVAPNIGFMVGHSAIRRVVMGEAAKERESTPTELDAMKAMLRAGLGAGGLGFSSSLARSHNDAAGDPVPSRCASVEELMALAEVCGEFPGTCLEMVPFVGPGPFPEPIEQIMIDLTVRSGRSLNWNIVNVTAANLDSVEAKLAVSDRARARGGRIAALFMPMPIHLRLNFLSGFVLDMMPGWDKLMALPAPEKLQMLRSPEGRAHMRELAESQPSHWNHWGRFVIQECSSPELQRYEGRAVADIAAEEGKDPFDTLVDLAVADELRTSFGPPPSGDAREDWEARGKVLRDPRVVVGASDAGAHLDMIDTFRYTTSLLSDCVREHGLLSTEEAVRLITQVPAELHGLRDRGVLREGAWADVVVFDEATVGSEPPETRADLPAGGRRLFAGSTGVGHVLVNGEEIVVDGASTDRRPGRVLRSGRDTTTPSL